MQLQAGGDLALTGSHVTATDSITATAGGSIELKAVKDRKMEEAEIGHRGGFYYNRVMTDDEKSGQQYVCRRRYQPAKWQGYQPYLQ